MITSVKLNGALLVQPIVHDLLAGDVTQLFSQIQQADFMFDDSYVILKHEGYLFMVG